MTKEENTRLKKRTGERLGIAQAKENYWRKFRDGGETGMKEKEREAWRNIRNSLLISISGVSYQ